MLVVPSDPTSVSLPPLSLSRLRPADNSDRSQPSAECASASMYKPACAVTGPDGGSFGGPVRRLAVGREDVREREGSSWMDSTEFLWGDRPNKTTPRNQRDGAHDSTAPHAPPQAGTELTHPTGRFPSGEPWATVRHTRTRHGSTPASRALIRRHGPRISRPEPKIDLSWPRGTIGGDRRSRLNGVSA